MEPPPAQAMSATDDFKDQAVDESAPAATIAAPASWISCAVPPDRCCPSSRRRRPGGTYDEVFFGF
ncbi:hypothetical protein ACP70R_027467 [Stipagrostis hirtigluma subsp. patula]